MYKSSTLNSCQYVVLVLIPYEVSLLPIYRFTNTLRPPENGVLASAPINLTLNITFNTNSLTYIVNWAFARSCYGLKSEHALVDIPGPFDAHFRSHLSRDSATVEKLVYAFSNQLEHFSVDSVWKDGSSSNGVFDFNSWGFVISLCREEI